MQSLLSIILLFPALGGLVLLCVPNSRTRLIRILGLTISFITFALSLLLWVFFDHSTAKFQFVNAVDWLPFLNMHFYIGIDGISLFFILQSAPYTSTSLATAQEEGSMAGALSL